MLVTTEARPLSTGLRRPSQPVPRQVSILLRAGVGQTFPSLEAVTTETTCPTRSQLNASANGDTVDASIVVGRHYCADEVTTRGITIGSLAQLADDSQWPRRFDSGGEPMSADGASVSWWLPISVESVALERALWILVACSLVGDLVTTFVGLHLGLVESNPVARGAIDALGMLGLVALKAGALAVAVGCRPLLPEAYRPIVPAALAVPWTAAVVVNVYVIASIV